MQPAPLLTLPPCLPLTEEPPHEGATQELTHPASGYSPGDATGPHGLDVTQDPSAPVEAPSDLGDGETSSATHVGYSFRLC